MYFPHVLCALLVLNLFICVAPKCENKAPDIMCALNACLSPIAYVWMKVNCMKKCGCPTVTE
ncbi:hypothetical protein TELCIR_23262 [Teladorsagia circumcincta]|uniref:ShKT domain-containing protein n=1 Tax=Teladorsagia circumcincta TaxID=45464 RepID=A0A2G9TCV0_TELCI|nr:hypothetical protein TELCIR_23262 [Teladorsagia circumcincta]